MRFQNYPVWSTRSQCNLLLVIASEMADIKYSITDSRAQLAALSNEIRHLISVIILNVAGEQKIVVYRSLRFSEYKFSRFHIVEPKLLTYKLYRYPKLKFTYNGMVKVTCDDYYKSKQFQKH